ncbi:hypothetical protein ACQZ2G_26265, partial [Pseudomonas viridiflava]|uniref:hypothetical protein n=1 Tax=Pseudomonas viridiflava TaxID=33069 RepID=UPI003D2D35D7
MLTLIVPHAPRGNASKDAPRPAVVGQKSLLRLTQWDAERPGLHAHAAMGTISVEAEHAAQ